MRGFALIVAALITFQVVTPASELIGKITLDHKMVKNPPPAAVYDLRGAAISNKSAQMHQEGMFGRVATWLEGGGSSAAAPVRAKMNQQGRHFEPDLLIVPAGSDISFPNLDPIFHNIFSLSRTQSFDLGYYSQGKTRNVTFPKEGIVQVYCHVHPEMYGVVVVTSSKWAAHPRPDGTFSWPDVPAGKYRLMIWQRSAGLLHKSITVPQSGILRVELKLPEEDEDSER